MSPKCTNWLGHKYEARHSVLPLTTPPKFTDYAVHSMTESTFLELAQLRAGSAYERDICVRCGHVVEKKS